VFEVFVGASERADVVGCRSVVVGSGSDLVEEPAIRDVEPATLAIESFPFVLPGPAYLVERRASVTRRR
jgi:hypothetical protein